MREEAERRAHEARADSAVSPEPVAGTEVSREPVEREVPREPAAPPHRPARRTSPSAEPVSSARRAARAAQLLQAAHDAAPPARHVRRRTARLAVAGGFALGAALLLGASAVVTALAVPPGATSAAASLALETPAAKVEHAPAPTVENEQEPAPPPVAPDICTVPEVVAAVQAGDDDAAVAAAGGGEAFRAAVVEGRATCIDLGDTARLWTVVNKHRPASPIDYRPSSVVMPDGVRNVEGGVLRGDAAAALTSLVTAARDAGAGEIALLSGFRPYGSQERTYARHFAQRGDQADQVSARPGHSEHQLGLGADVVACTGACGSLDELAATTQGRWLSEHAWEHGWIVRYVEGKTDVTGYLPEPWHLRYVGPQLARAYHDGGWASLEEFFGLEPAPDYLG